MKEVTFGEERQLLDSAEQDITFSSYAQEQNTPSK